MKGSRFWRDFQRVDDDEEEDGRAVGKVWRVVVFGRWFVERKTNGSRWRDSIWLHLVS